MKNYKSVQTWAPQFILSQYTMWKNHDFPITQILREINFRGSRSAKCAILTHIEALNFHLYEFWHFLKSPKMAKTAVLELLDSPKLNSRKI